MNTTVKTKYGILEGIETENAFVFKGVPYAAAPVGKLRFAAPQACEPWDGVRKADTFPRRALQDNHEPGSFYQKELQSNPDYLPETSEDCLYLNIWAPKNMDKPCPVAFWIHGGAFINGFSSEIEFDGEEYARRGVILVTINYRLGFTGFFSHPDLIKRDGRCGNYGILDQNAALDWVNENIADFGGDAGNVTIFGQSAGCMSVRNLVLSPLTKGKIAKAIMQSGGGYGGTFGGGAATMEQAAEFGAKFLESLGLTLDDVLALDEVELQKLTGKCRDFAFANKIRGGMGPIIDDYAITMDTNTAIGEDKIHDIDYMIGCTKNDMGIKLEDSYDRTKNMLLNSCIEFCRVREKQGKPCHIYYFMHDLAGDNAGAFHSSELWYMFGTLSRCWRPMVEADYALSKEMLDAWTGFMKNAQPGWDRWTEANPVVRDFK